jgi:small neutral amino acid transporter SnatA (MarC family)
LRRGKSRNAVEPVTRCAVRRERLSGPIARRLGPIGINIVTRVMGMLVTATAFGLLAREIGGLLPGVAR